MDLGLLPDRDNRVPSHHRRDDRGGGRNHRGNRQASTASVAVAEDGFVTPGYHTSEATGDDTTPSDRLALPAGSHADGSPYNSVTGAGKVTFADFPELGV